ncbi:hypothetical protein UM396_16950 [Geobacillus subterraneus]|uniref:hypothetical protein n=1 Tax=Geobacillus subterraneus TaxID=129338 RepID=UPI002AC9A19E|nr:hypothetical protein [Geobacillus subterraneus]WPZ18215.1 hypothetical protein UM396_16950 [Geobacillus subterraneus]
MVATPFCLSSYQSLPFSAVKSVTMTPNIAPLASQDRKAQARPTVADAAKEVDKQRQKAAADRAALSPVGIRAVLSVQNKIMARIGLLFFAVKAGALQSASTSLSTCQLLAGFIC